MTFGVADVIQLFWTLDLLGRSRSFARGQADHRQGSAACFFPLFQRLWLPDRFLGRQVGERLRPSFSRAAPARAQSIAPIAAAGSRPTALRGSCLQPRHTLLPRTFLLQALTLVPKLWSPDKMRLLEYGPDGGFAVTENLPDNENRKYVILSHTWESEEVTFEDLKNGTGNSKAGFKKIRFCAEQAMRDGLRYFWVDTCCIDKSNHVELNEAIISMFRWYRKAVSCYVYLSDVLAAGCGLEQKRKHSESWEEAFRESRWFTRGWTLQELLAPASVEYFTPDGQRLGDKKSLEQTIHEITEIATSALRSTDLSHFDVRERFQWAETRQTTREEDWAYCLLGIFDVSMSALYGEGKEKAIRRLKEKIRASLSPELRSSAP